MSKSNTAAIDTALLKAKKLWIPEYDLRKALVLIRDFRIASERLNLDPRAVRIALIFGDLCDYHFAKDKLSTKELTMLREIANDLYLGTRRRT